MRCSSRPDRPRQAEIILHARLLAFILTVVLTTSPATAKNPPPAPDPAGPTATAESVVPVVDGKRWDKYDVEHMGQRGIGHGFNIYSEKREHEPGRNIAASFDRLTKKIDDAVANDYVNRLAQKIVRYSDADIPFTIKVIDSGDVPRAYGLPGGFL